MSQQTWSPSPRGAHDGVGGCGEGARHSRETADTGGPRFMPQKDGSGAVRRCLKGAECPPGRRKRGAVEG